MDTTQTNDISKEPLSDEKGGVITTDTVGLVFTVFLEPIMK